jgi:hypothetical protein
MHKNKTTLFHNKQVQDLNEQDMRRKEMNKRLSQPPYACVLKKENPTIKIQEPLPFSYH